MRSEMLEPAIGREYRLTPSRPLDPLSEAVGSQPFVVRHRFPVSIDMGIGRSPRLSVSRYYWSAEPPVVVDFVRDLRFGRREVEVKTAWFAERNIRYVVCETEFDVETVEATLKGVPIPDRFDPATVEAVVPVADAAPPAVGPSRRRR